ncbi:MAG: four helix bundle suffix domain-containing protein [Lentimicrobiaceae bacterium]|nr:four helix bundle suffix domain-containing protein [Lentimicrobiaceae bacterium]
MENDKTNSQYGGFIPKHGGYRKLLCFQKAEIIYDGTCYFVEHFLQKSDRTTDQMVQAARSGKQNIAEGSMASAMSKQSEMFLTNVAKASLEELMLDYEDFLRIRKLAIWGKDHHLTKRFQTINRTANATYETYRKALENENPEICANAMLCLIHAVIVLIARLLQQQERDFLQNGGIKERMMQMRVEAKMLALKAKTTAPPFCPNCGKPMILRKAAIGKNAGKEFWGCTEYPECKGVVNVEKQ